MLAASGWDWPLVGGSCCVSLRGAQGRRNAGTQDAGTHRRRGSGSTRNVPMLSWWTSILLLFNGTSLLANYLSAIAGWTLVLVLVLIIWKRRHFHFGSFTLGVLVVILVQAWISKHESLNISFFDSLT